MENRERSVRAKHFYDAYVKLQNLTTFKKLPILTFKDYEEIFYTYIEVPQNAAKQKECYKKILDDLDADCISTFNIRVKMARPQIAKIRGTNQKTKD